ncbi:MAG TPA: alpha/beta fold hydrolase, partial [Aggregatilineales bacterium]|nr:alpha/beta fold hydrolase [Aggregatilineales bacterium]
MNLVVYGAIYAPAHSKIGDETPSDWGFTYEDVSFVSEDNLTLRGWYIPSQNSAAIILLHGYGGNRRAMKFMAQALAGTGYGVLMYDMRGHGESDGNSRSFGWKDVPDVLAAVDFLQKQPDVEKIGILGHSVGAQVTVRAAAQTDEIEAVIMDGVSSAFY